MTLSKHGWGFCDVAGIMVTDVEVLDQAPYIFSKALKLVGPLTNVRSHFQLTFISPPRFGSREGG